MSTVTKAGILVAGLCAWFIKVTLGQPSAPIDLRVTGEMSSPTYYVSTLGSATNGGTQISPWSLSFALTQLAPGVTVTLMPGIYNGPVMIPANVSGTAQLPITIKSQFKWAAVIANATNGTLEGISVNARHTSYLILDGFCVSNNMGDGLAVNNYSVVKNCWITRNHQQGINLTSPTCSNNVVEYNLVENNGVNPPAVPGSGHWHGLYLSGPNNIVRGNVFRNNTNGYGMILYTENAGGQNWNNTIYDNLVYGSINRWGVALWGAVDGGAQPGTNYFFNNTVDGGIYTGYGTVFFTNNIILPALTDQSVAIANLGGFNGSAAIAADYNLCTLAIAPAGSSNSIGGHNSVTRSVGFVNITNGLYWLSATSAARGMACTNQVPPSDFFGNPQSQVTDVGAFQYSAACASDTRILYAPPLSAPDYWVPLY
ncbi:MAG: right-handed parallel beta-helix repeat-containing protein [Verrucomicrobiota bacterium]